MKIISILFLIFSSLPFNRNTSNFNLSESKKNINPYVLLFEIEIDGTKYTANDQDIILPGFYEKSNFLIFGIQSKNKNIKFALSARMLLLDTGTFKIWNRGAKFCEPKYIGDPYLQTIGLMPYEENKSLPPYSEVLTAHNLPNLGLAPFTLKITSVIKEQPPELGNFIPTMKIKGDFFGKLAALKFESKECELNGAPKNITGKFEFYCPFYKY
jgi:hypothetical protein